MIHTNKTVVRIKDVMRGNYVEMDGLMTVKDALVQMKANNASYVIIKKRHEHDEYGVVMLSDIAKKVLAKDKSPERVNIYEIMSKPVVSVTPEMDVRYCARLFDNFGLASAPVMENGVVIGVVGYKALVFEGILVENHTLD
jgi:signal-transduction protein with cAMP-binding, CBS, and nucleotidyltransferase domain